MRNKKIIIAISLAMVLIILTVVVVRIKTKNKEPGDKQNYEIPESIKAIMNNNVTGTLKSINEKNITLQVENEIKNFSLGDFTFVIDSRGEIQNRKLSDLKKDMEIYVHFDKDTDKALDITILK